MSTVKLKSYAKLNLFLDVTALRENGYHELCSVMQTISLHDRIKLETTGKKDKVDIYCNRPYVPTDGRNIAYKAAALFFEKTKIENNGLFISIIKRIPVGAGLAGGSGNAAAVLVGLNKLTNAGLTIDVLSEMGSALGADVPYCITGGTALATGIGDELSPLPDMGKCYIVVAKPRRSISTPTVYKSFDETGFLKALDFKKFKKALEKSPFAAAELMGNALQPVTEKLCPEITPLLKKLLEGGAYGAMMSGSGTAVFGIFAEKDKAESCASSMKKAGTFVQITTPVRNGVELV